MLNPARGEVWMADLNPIRGREQGGSRPVLVLSEDRFNRSLAELVIVVPITSKQRAIPWHVEIIPPEGGLKQNSYAKCENIRSIAKERLVNKLGKVSNQILMEVEDRIRVLLGL